MAVRWVVAFAVLCTLAVLLFAAERMGLVSLPGKSAAQSDVR